MFELWQATGEPYRLSVAYVVRTVLLDSTRTHPFERLVVTGQP